MADVLVGLTSSIFVAPMYLLMRGSTGRELRITVGAQMRDQVRAFDERMTCRR